MKKIEAVNVYSTLATAKITNMDAVDKYIVIRAMKELKKIHTDYTEFVKDTQEKLKLENLEELQSKAQKWDELVEPERIALNKVFNTYQKEVEECLTVEANEECAFEFTKLSEDAFSKLVDSNDFTIEVILLLENALV